MEINYQASNTGAQLHASDKFIRCIKGPVGSGKTVVCLQELFKQAALQWPNAKGKRLTRWVVIRNTSIELQTTTLNSFKQWFPPPLSAITLSPFIRARIELPLADGTTIDTEFYFLALDRDDDVRKLLSLEVSGGFMNETRELGYAVLKALRERSGRYPAQIDGYQDTKGYKAPRNEKGEYEPLRRKCIVADTNPCDTDHWWYQLAVEGCLRNAEDKERDKSEVKRLFDFFDCPPPLFKRGAEYIPNPDADNIDYLPGGHQYYLDMLGGNTPDHINVMVLGNYGVIRDGKPVFPEYNDALHCANDVRASKEFPICLGWDFGLTPSCIIGQMNDRGAVRIIAELVTEDMHVRQFARDIVKPFLQRYFPNVPIGFSLGDPSGNFRGEGEGKTAIGILNDEYIEEFDDEPLEMGFVTEPAPTNDPDKRLDAVKSYLIRLIDGAPAIVINAEMCPLLRKGFQGMYRYKKVQTPGKSEVYHDKPVKDKWSHCFNGETLINVKSGNKKISEIKPGELVNTHFGFKRVKRVFSQSVNELCEITLSTGKKIICTPNHPFYTVENGIVRADELQYLSLIDAEKKVNKNWVERLNIQYKNLREYGFTKSRRDITKRTIENMARYICTNMCMNFITAPFQRVTKYITKIIIEPTTIYQTLNYSLALNIDAFTLWKKGVNEQKDNQKLCSQRLKSGTHHQRAAPGIVSTLNKFGKNKRKQNLFAHIAVNLTKLTKAALKNSFVQCLVKEWRANYLALMMHLEPVKCAAKRLFVINTLRKNTVVKVVQVKQFQTLEKIKVYDLEVESAHTFYAGGVLVHNCQDATQYLMLGFKGGYNPDMSYDPMYDDDQHHISQDYW